MFVWKFRLDFWLNMREDKRLLEGIVEDVLSERYNTPVMPDDSYAPDILKWGFRLTVPRFTLRGSDPSKDVIVNNVPSYSLRGEGWAAWGLYNLGTDQISNDREQDGYGDTLEHEVEHARYAANEYLARVKTGDYNSGLAA